MRPSHIILAALLSAGGSIPAIAAPGDSPICRSDWLEQRIPASIGDPAMGPAMDALRAAFAKGHPAAKPSLAWDHSAQSRAIGALMYERADLAPITRDFGPAELAPYEHQFRGDMIKAPFTVRIGTVNGAPALLAMNRRPDSPLPARITDFVRFALSPAGQAALAQVKGFTTLAPEAAAREASRLDGFVAPLSPALGNYVPVPGLSGVIASDGSDGMKDLVDGWMCRFVALQPLVRKGSRWEHLGTLNGFHAMINQEADMAPMGRELWPSERADWQETTGTPAPVEIAVARGGFNTPQRTTAQAIFVHPDNPLRQISLDQFRAIFGKGSQPITRWGQLGLTGAWADRPIHVRMPPRVTPNAMSMQINVLKGANWTEGAVEAPYADTAKALLADPAAIGFGGLEEGAPGLVPLAVAGDGGQPVELNALNVSTGRYPLPRLMYIRLAPGKPAPQTIAFLRYILSREGQERVRYSGYFPLTAPEAQRELAVLDRLAKP